MTGPFLRTRTRVLVHATALGTVLGTVLGAGPAWAASAPPGPSGGEGHGGGQYPPGGSGGMGHRPWPGGGGGHQPPWGGGHQPPWRGGDGNHRPPWRGGDDGPPWRGGDDTPPPAHSDGPPTHSGGSRSSSGEDSATCRSGSSCTAHVAGGDSNFTITADGGDRTAVLVAKVNGGSAPECPGYHAHAGDWVQFRFRDGQDGASWAKSGTLTFRDTLGRSAAQALADAAQVCFEAPYEFHARSGYQTADRAGGHDAVLPDCDRDASGPCVTDRTAVRSGDGWTVRLNFRVPASAEDPKALG